MPAGEPGGISQINVVGLPENAAPTVVNSGTSNKAVLNLGIPKGDKGVKGDPGPAGPRGVGGTPGTINIGTVKVLPAGSTPTVTNTGTKTNAILNFGFPACACSTQPVSQ